MATTDKSLVHVGDSVLSGYLKLVLTQAHTLSNIPDTLGANTARLHADLLAATPSHLVTECLLTMCDSMLDALEEGQSVNVKAARKSQLLTHTREALHVVGSMAAGVAPVAAAAAAADAPVAPK